MEGAAIRQEPDAGEDRFDRQSVQVEHRHAFADRGDVVDRGPKMPVIVAAIGAAAWFRHFFKPGLHSCHGIGALGKFRVEAVELKASRLGPAGPVYESLGAAPLRGSA